MAVEYVAERMSKQCEGTVGSSNAFIEGTSITLGGMGISYNEQCEVGLTDRSEYEGFNLLSEPFGLDMHKVYLPWVAVLDLLQ